MDLDFSMGLRCTPQGFVRFVHDLGRQTKTKYGVNPFRVESGGDDSPLTATIRFCPLEGGKYTGRILVTTNGVDMYGELAPHSGLHGTIPGEDYLALKDTWALFYKALRRGRLYLGGFVGDMAPLPPGEPLVEPSPGAPIEAWFAWRWQEMRAGRAYDTLKKIAEVMKMDYQYVKNLHAAWKNEHNL